MIENPITVQLGSSFMLNAGICGFIRFLEHNNARKGIDYEYGGQSLSISSDYLKSNNIPELYIDTMADIFEKNTKYYRIISEKGRIDSLNKAGIENLDEKQPKDLKDMYKSFADLMLKNSYASVYEILPDYAGLSPVNKPMLEDFKKETDLTLKYEKYLHITELLEQRRLTRLLIYTELIYTSFKLFFSENPMSKKITCLCESKKKYEATYNDKFFAPLIDESEIDEKKKKSICIECMNPMANKKELTFLVDTADDLGKKKSYYWNCKPDAYACPSCSFIYSFIPLGFTLIGSEAVFINSNSSIETMIQLMYSLREKTDDDSEKSVRRRIMRIFTAEKIDALSKTGSNIQVIMRSSGISHFRFDTIDRSLIDGLGKGKDYLSRLERKWIPLDGGNLISVYDTVFDRILSRLTLYPFIDKIMKHEIDKTTGLGYLKGILRLEIIFHGGNNMDELNKKIDSAFHSGKALRMSILGAETALTASSEDDNRLRSFVYRLVNLASVGDCPQFIDTVIRIYAGFNLTIPAVFKDCYKSDEMFKAIAHGFILGLKYVKYDPTESKEEK